MAIRLLCLIFRSSRCYRYIRILWIRAGAFCSRLVDDLASEYVGLSYCVTCCELLACVRCQTCDRPLIICQFIGYRDIRNRQVAVVLDSDLVADRVAKCISALRSLACSLLSDRDMAVRILGRIFLSTRCDRYFRFIRIRAGACCSRLVDYLTSEYVSLSYCVTCCELFRCIRCQ